MDDTLKTTAGLGWPHGEEAEMAARDDMDFGRLADWVEGRLPAEEAAAVEELVEKADEETRADVAWLRAFREVSEETALLPLPPDVHEDLAGRFESRFGSRSEARSGTSGRRFGPLRRLVAGLAFDGAPRAAFGVRSAGARESRQVVYSSDAADVALNVRRRPGGESFDVDGQVLVLDGGPDPGSFAVRLLRGEDEAGRAAASGIGEFSFEAVAPGAYDVVLVGGGGLEILLPGLELRP